ncbi:MAG: hypothetical protein FWC11_02675 [Firmicutes bacterium]|nr:hypothetical protein [Bacillota bacterium]
MLNCLKLCDITECDLLALNTLITKEIMKSIKDADTLNMIGDLLSSIGANLLMASNQRSKCQNKSNINSNNNANSSSSN